MSPGDYIFFPIATFATDASLDGKDVCQIYAQYIPIDDASMDTQDYSIILGTMFMQSFYLSKLGSSEIYLTRNPNALPGTDFIGLIKATGPSPFNITASNLNLTTDYITTMNVSVEG